jgi:hypothetical protein
MTRFEDQLFADLMREHGPALAHTTPPAASRRHIASRRTLAMAGVGCLAVAGTAGALVAGGGSPAYALATHKNGTVTLDVYQKSGIAQINSKLRQIGDNVYVVPVAVGCPSLSSLPAPPVTPQGHISVQGSSSEDGSVTVNAQGIPAGDILVVGVETNVTSSGTYSMTGSRLTAPPPPSCVSLPTGPPPGGGVTTGGHGGSVTTGGHRGPGSVTRRGVAVTHGSESGTATSTSTSPATATGG